MINDRTIYICGICNKEYTREEIDKNSHFSPCGHVAKCNMSVFVYPASVIINKKCPICNSVGIDLGKSSIRTCGNSNCTVITFNTLADRQPHPLEAKAAEFKDKISSYKQRWTRADVVLKIFNEIFGEEK